MRTWKSHIQNILALFICGDFAVLEGKVQQHADHRPSYGWYARTKYKKYG